MESNLLSPFLYLDYVGVFFQQFWCFGFRIEVSHRHGNNFCTGYASLIQFFCIWTFSFPALFIEDDIFFLCMFFASLSNIRKSCSCLALLFHSIGLQVCFVLILYCFVPTALVMYLEVWSGNLFSIIHFVQDCFDCAGPFLIPYKFQNFLFL